MDAFFASVEERDNPKYRGKPVIVGSDPKGGKGRGVVSACSYEARKFGIHSAMPVSTAYRKCPHGIFLPVDMRKYAAVSEEILGLLESFTPEIEPVSIDEAFLDITGSYHLFGSPGDVCLKIKSDIKRKTGLTASIGMAPNMMTAKIASDIGKPDGFVIVATEGLRDFLFPLPAGRLWGVGEKTLATLKKMGINTIGNIARYDPDELCRVLGVSGLHIWELANGIDPRRVEGTGTVKSVSNEYTFDSDVTDWEAVKKALLFLSEKVSRRMRISGFKGRTVTLKIRFSDFKTYTRSVTLDMPTNFIDDIYRNALGKAGPFESKRCSGIRLVGVRVSNLAEFSFQGDLFDGKAVSAEKKERIHKAVDSIRDKFGEKAVRRGGV
ncbi:MAG: DNA polymerase IV, partial [Candidatus Omnitrophota bacterium]